MGVNYLDTISKPMRDVITRRDEFNALSDLDKVKYIKNKYGLSHGKGSKRKKNKKRS